MKSIAPSCSDDRMGLARRGALSSSALLDFATHMSTCADCRIAWRLAADFAGSAGAVPGDEHLVARAAKMALASAPRARGGLVRVRVAAASSAILLMAGAASAAIALHARYSAPARSEAAPAGSEARSVKTRRKSAGAPASGRELNAGASDPLATPALEPAVVPPTPAPAPATVQAAAPSMPVVAASPARAKARAKDGPEGSAAHAPRPARLALAPPAATSLQPPPLASPEPPASAKAMFERAVSARHEGRLRAAIDSFRALQSHFPGTPEALVSLVSLGELLLNAGAAPEALAAFDAYEGSAPAGALVPEALAGEARALAQLGRARESEVTWRELARRFPASPYAYRAAKMDVDRPAP